MQLPVQGKKENETQRLAHYMDSSSNVEVASSMCRNAYTLHTFSLRRSTTRPVQIHAGRFYTRCEYMLVNEF